MKLCIVMLILGVTSLNAMTGGREYFEEHRKSTTSNPSQGEKSTSDGWVQQPTGSNANVSGLFFLDGATGIGVGGETVFRTTDGGSNWVVEPETGLFRAVWFFDGDTGTAVGWGGNNGIIQRSTDQGTNWVQLAPPGGNLNDVHYADSQNAMAVGHKIIVGSTDGGITWSIQLFGTIPPMGGVRMIDESVAVAVGGTGAGSGIPTVLHTSDGGTSWQTISTPATGALNAVDFADMNSGIAVGNGGTIIRTTDAGLTWSLESSNTTNSLYAIRFNPSRTEAIAVGSFGTILQSSDGGITWIKEVSPTTEGLFSVAPTVDTGWTVGGGNGVILHRSSSTISFPSVSVEVQIDSLSKIVPAEGDTFTYQMTFTNLTSIPQAIDVWTKVLRPIGNPIDPLYGPETLDLDPFEVVVIDTAQIALPFDARTGDYSLIAFVGTYQTDTLDSDTTYFAKLPLVPCEDISQFKARCRPGGTVQARITLTDTSHAGDRVEFTVDGIAYEATVSQNRRALISLPGYSSGQHVVELTEPPGCFEPITVTCPIGLERVGDDWEWDQHDEFSGKRIQRTKLHDSYPNPFNPTTTIRFDLSVGTHVSLKVYDILGREVATLVDEFLDPGYHQVPFDGSKLASGIYFSRLQAGSFSDVKELLLVR